MKRKLTRLLVQWRQAVLDQWDRFQEADRLVDETTGAEKSIMRDREFTHIQFLLVAIAQVLKLEDRATKVLSLERRPNS
jgi:hypothetical protein